MKKHLLFCLCGFFALSSCQKKAEDVGPAPRPAPGAAEEPTTAFLRTTPSNAAAAEYISGEFNGYRLYCTTNPWPTMTGTFYAYDATHQDTGYLVRQSPDRAVQLSLTFSQTDVFRRAMPACWPRPNPAFCEYISLEVRNLRPDNSEVALFTGASDYGDPRCRVQVCVTSIQDSVIEGTFEGSLLHYVYPRLSGAAISVKNGKFRIKTHVRHL